ncbi:MAG: hypothetical protein Q9180_008340, partial [Flavoplaca navasiana]
FADLPKILPRAPPIDNWFSEMSDQQPKSIITQSQHVEESLPAPLSSAILEVDDLLGYPEVNGGCLATNERVNSEASVAKNPMMGQEQTESGSIGLGIHIPEDHPQSLEAVGSLFRPIHTRYWCDGTFPLAHHQLTHPLKEEEQTQQPFGRFMPRTGTPVLERQSTTDTSSPTWEDTSRHEMVDSDSPLTSGRDDVELFGDTKQTSNAGPSSSEYTQTNFQDLLESDDYGWLEDPMAMSLFGL